MCITKRINPVQTLLVQETPFGAFPSSFLYSGGKAKVTRRRGRSGNWVTEKGNAAACQCHGMLELQLGLGLICAKETQ